MKKANLTVKTIFWGLLLSVYVSLFFLAGKITHMVTKLKKCFGNLTRLKNFFFFLIK